VVFPWFAATAADVKTLRESWGSVRGGWRGARRDGFELVGHRRIQVDTQAMMPEGMRVVLRTRVRLNGDTETDILRRWFDTVAPAALEASAAVHFRGVAAAVAGFAAATSLERLIVRAGLFAGSVVSFVVALRHILQTDPSQVVWILLGDWMFWTALLLVLAVVLLRLFLRWRLRAIFRRGPPGSPAR
jgi:hypothetical protein